MDIEYVNENGLIKSTSGKGEVGGTNPNKNEAETCGMTPYDLMGELGLKPSALSYYLSKMRKQGVLRKEKVGKNVFYVLVRPEEVLQTLISYRWDYQFGYPIVRASWTGL